MRIEFHWFEGCPNHRVARRLLQQALEARAFNGEIQEIDVGDPAVANRYRSPGSPTIRINGHDIEPGYQDPGEYAPRCRLYMTSAGLVGVPDRRWIEEALDLRTKPKR